MATNEHTQAYLDSLTAPQRLAPGRIAELATAALPIIQELREQVAEWKTRGQLASFAEESPEVDQALEAFHQQVAVGDRVAADLEKSLRELGSMQRQLAYERARLAPFFTGLGYQLEGGSDGARI